MKGKERQKTQCRNAVTYYLLNVVNRFCVECTGSGSGVVIGCGFQTTHILPVLGGQLDIQQCRRINLGGAHVDGFLQRLLQLKYPGHLTAVTLPRAEVQKEFCMLNVDLKRKDVMGPVCRYLVLVPLLTSFSLKVICHSKS